MITFKLRQKKRFQNHNTKGMNEKDDECTCLVQFDDGKLLVPDEVKTEELQAQIGTMMEKIQEGDYCDHVFNLLLYSPTRLVCVMIRASKDAQRFRIYPYPYPYPSWKCKVCGKMTKGSLTQMKRHVETHLEGVSHTCNQCGKVSRSGTALSMHVHIYHRK